MKYLFIIYLSEDGIYGRGFTNVSVLYKELANMEGYIAESLEGDEPQDDNVTFNYTNLNRIIKSRISKNRISVSTVYCQGGSRMEIHKIWITSR